MRIVDVRVVRVEFPKRAVPEGRSESANKSWALRVHPINKYREFSRSHRQMPGAAPHDFWVQVIAEDGTWGLGAGSYGPPVTTITPRLR